MTTQIRRAVVTGTGSCLPEKIMTNSDFEKIVDTTDEWITTRTGIKERHIAEPDTACSDLAAGASKRAIANAGLKPEDIDLILVATVTPDHFFPSTACRVQAKIGAFNAGAVDLSAACSGFVYAVGLANGYIACGAADRILVIGSEILTKFVDYTDRTTCILFGDGAGAAVLEAASDGRGVQYSLMGADGRGGDMMIIPAGGSAMPPSEQTVADRNHYIIVRGREVFKFAVNRMQWLIQDAADKCGIKPEDIDIVIPHQVNIRILKSAADKFGFPMDKIFVNIDRVGNTSGASVPIALAEANEKGLIKQGDLVLLIGFGGGLTWSSAVIRW